MATVFECQVLSCCITDKYWRGSGTTLQPIGQTMSHLLHSLRVAKFHQALQHALRSCREWNCNGAASQAGLLGDLSQRQPRYFKKRSQ